MGADIPEHDQTHGTPLALRTERPLPGVVVVAAAGEIDSATAPHLLQSLLAATKDDPDHLIVDLRAVTFFCGAGITVLLTVRHDAAGGAFDLHLTGVRGNRPVEMVLDLTGVTKLFAIQPSVDAAIVGIAYC